MELCTLPLRLKRFFFCLCIHTQTKSKPHCIKRTAAIPTPPAFFFFLTVYKRLVYYVCHAIFWKLNFPIGARRLKGKHVSTSASLLKKYSRPAVPRSTFIVAPCEVWMSQGIQSCGERRTRGQARRILPSSVRPGHRCCHGNQPLPLPLPSPPQVSCFSNRPSSCVKLPAGGGGWLGGLAWLRGCYGGWVWWQVTG